MKPRDYAVSSLAVGIALGCRWLVAAFKLSPVASGLILTFLLICLRHSLALRTLLRAFSVTVLFVLPLCRLPTERSVDLIPLLAFGIAFIGLNRRAQVRVALDAAASTMWLEVGNSQCGRVRIKTQYRALTYFYPGFL